MQTQKMFEELIKGKTDEEVEEIIEYLAYYISVEASKALVESLHQFKQEILLGDDGWGTPVGLASQLPPFEDEGADK